MPVFGGNCTDETSDLIAQVVKDNEFIKFSLQNRINLEDKTILIRLALINLINGLPSNEEVAGYKAALLRPYEFDDHLKSKLGMEVAQ